MSTDRKPEEPSGSFKLFPNILLLIPFLALLWVPFYDDVQPTLYGFPFFYWYQLLWVPLTSVIIYIVYKADKQ